MKGTNSLVLNQQTVCEALQVWLDKTLQPGHGGKVTVVRAAANNSSRNAYTATGDDFEVVIETAEKEPVKE